MSKLQTIIRKWYRSVTESVRFLVASGISSRAGFCWAFAFIPLVCHLICKPCKVKRNPYRFSASRILQAATLRVTRHLLQFHPVTRTSLLLAFGPRLPWSSDIGPGRLAPRMLCRAARATMEVVQSGSTLMGSSVSGPGAREGLEVVQSDATFCVAGAAGSGGVDVLKFVSRCCVASRTGSA